MSPRAGAVVVGGDFQGLGIVRSLGRRGIPVLVVDDEYSIAPFSRYTSRAVRVPRLREPGEIVEVLLDVGRRFDLGGWVLYPTREEIVVAIARHRSALERFYRVPTPPWATIQWAWDKRNTYRLAEQLSIPAPRTWSPAGASDLAVIDTAPPWLIKPAIKEHFIYATRVKAWRANNRFELAERFEQAARLVGPGEVMVQELIPGDGGRQFAYCAFFKAAQAIGAMTARRQRQHPPELGRASTFVETVERPILEELSHRFLRAIDYYGLVEIEYKQDPRDGMYKLLDVNARTWGYHSLGFRAGVDFPFLLFADQTGGTAELCRARPGVRWIRLVTDLPTGALEIFRGRISLSEYWHSLRGWHIESVFSREDPLPGLVELALVPYLAVRRGF